MIKKALYIFVLSLVCSCSNDENSTVPESNLPPEDFTLISVEDNATDVGLFPIFEWNMANDPEGEDIAYSILLEPNMNPTDIVASSLNETRYMANERLDTYETYFWKVVAEDSDANTTESDMFSFNTRGLNFSVPEVTNDASFPKRLTHKSVVFDNKIWVIGGIVENGDRVNDIWSSTNGISWDESTTSTLFSGRSSHTLTVFDDKLWLIAGRTSTNPTIDNNDVWYSRNGETWTPITTSALFSERFGHSTVVFNNRLWVIAGFDGSHRNDIWSSTDGATWNEIAASAAFSNRSSHTSVVFDGKMWVIGGFSSDEGAKKNDVWSSSDGITWTEATGAAQFAERDFHTSVVFDNKIWVIGGVDQDGNEMNDLWYSEDGIIWIEATSSAPFSERRSHSSVVFNNKIWVIGGLDINNSLLNDVWAFE